MVRGLVGFIAVLGVAAFSACGDADQCAKHDRRCVDNEAQLCSDDGLWETVLTCDEDTFCSVAINRCIVYRGQTPCCM